MDCVNVIEKYLSKDKYDLCCSEATFYAANEYFNLNLSKDTLKVGTAFCGGNHTEQNCGLLTTSIIILTLLYATDVSHKCQVIGDVIEDYTNLFENIFSTSNCKQLKSLYRLKDVGCKNLIVANFELLVNFVEDNEI